MTDEPDGPSQEQPPAATLSPEFLGGNTKAGLEKIRTRLLDLTNRNRLLNFRHSPASSLRVVDVDLNSVFRRLMDGEKMAFVPVPDPELPVVAEAAAEGQEPPPPPAKPSAAEHAQALGWNTSYDLQPDANRDFDRLPVLLYLEALEAITRKIGSSAKTAIEESGTNMLYLTLGFLEWYEADDSQQPRLAPLLTIPVALDRTAAKGRGFECTVEYSGDDVTMNLSLLEKMRRDFGLEVPPIEDEDTPEQYFARFAPILSQKTRWRIRPQITLSLLSFGKLLMYRDLSPEAWPAILSHTLVKELFEGRKRDTITHATEYLLDEEEARGTILPPLILDADSSQHSALIDALRGENLVIEGPPGTGKSQTITNLIAAALVEGKTVLFVSEKLAALKVVRRRLDEAGLGAFCLELHSHKTRKDALLRDVEARIKAHRSFREPRELAQHLATLQQKKRLLTNYATFINSPLGPFGGTVFDILWARDHQYQELPFDHGLIEELVLPSVVGFNRAQRTDAEQFLSIYAQHLGGVLRGGSALDQYPWSWVAKPLAFDEQERAFQLLRSLVGAVAEAGQVRDTLESAVGISLQMSVDGLANAADLLSAIPEGAADVDLGLLAACRDQRNRDALSELVSSVETAATAAQRLEGATVGETQQSLLEESGASAMAAVGETLRGLGREKTCGSELQQSLEAVRATEDQLVDAGRAFDQMVELLGCEAAATQRNVEFLLHCVDLLERAPTDVLHLRSDAFEREAVGPIVREATARARTLHEQRGALEVRLDFGAAASLGCHRLRDDAAILDRSRLWSRWFGHDFRTAKREYRRIALGKSKVSPGKMSRDLRDLAEHLDECARFERKSAYRDALGPLFQGLETSWDNLRRLVEWYERVFTLLPESEAAARVFRDVLLTSRSDRLRAALARLQELRGHRELLERMSASFSELCGRFATAFETSASWAESLRSLKDVDSRLSETLATLRKLGIKPDLSLNELPDLIGASAVYRQHAASVARNHVARELLADRFAGTDTRTEMISETVAFAAAVCSGGLPASAATWVLTGDGAERLRMLRASLADAASCARAVQETGRTLDELCGSTTWTLGSEPLKAITSRARLALENVEDLLRWTHFLRVREEATTRGLDKLTSLGESRAVEPELLLPAFRFVFFNTLARRLFVDHPELSVFSGVTQAETRRQFAETDRRVITLQRERAASIIDNRPVPQGNQTGPVRRWTELALVDHEIKKQKRHIPIRQLMRRSGRALQAMKPCFMMGPLSVAQYLEPNRLKFDVVVMDEASQLKPEDAIGAIARGGQMVVVGDPKQLPPTNFFQRVEAEDDDELEERTVVEEGESILDVASTLYQPVRRLRWHYRSRHHSLIAFSNREFYQGDLVVFPSAYHDDPGLGVRYHPVYAGAFENRRNPREAAAVVEAVLDHMDTHPDESLGVVALNFEQRDLIEELLDRRLQEPLAVAYQDRMEDRLEPFFVKNLENVQGDERDVIFISATYGPDSRGNQYQRFGPITGPNGHRRLNVLFTRSKRRTEVFSSLDPDKIQTGGTSWGVRALKEYLTFARTGILEVARGDSGRPTNDFEDSVGAVLRERGFDVEPQVGVAGFFIDLGVRNPAKPGTFVLGIECDGATYHSSKSARDRDRLRQEILENLGWKLHRIWSTDWFKSRNAEIKRLVDRVERELDADPDYRRERQRAQQVESVRDQLVALRETEIRQAFPGSPEEKCLLRQAVLDELVRKRPRSREDWFRMIPYDLRDATDAAQIGRYLPRVLEIINASFDSDS